MDKKKREQVIVLSLIPIFLLGLLYMRSRNIRHGSLEELVSGLAEYENIGNIPEPAPVAEVKYQPCANDPFKDLLAAYLDKIRKEHPNDMPAAGKEKRPLPTLDIEGLIWNSDMPQAIVNGTVVKVGDSIEDARLVKISKTGITVEYDGEAVFVPKKQ